VRPDAFQIPTGRALETGLMQVWVLVRLRDVSLLRLAYGAVVDVGDLPGVLASGCAEAFSGAVVALGLITWGEGL
jgi:hypothetical protein